MSDNISARQNDSSGPKDSAGDGQLSAPPPVFTEAEAEGLARDYFGLTGQATRLTSERDANCRIRNGGGSHVLKIANPAEAPEVTNLQTMALLHIAEIDPGLAVQRVLPSLEGRHEEILQAGDGRPMVLRLFTYLEGEPLHLAPRSEAQRRSIGANLARLGRALRDFAHPAAGHELVWDIKHAGRMRQYLPFIEEAERGLLVERILRAFDDFVQPAMPGLRQQFVHNDLNPYNVPLLAFDQGLLHQLLSVTSSPDPSTPITAPASSLSRVDCTRR